MTPTLEDLRRDHPDVCLWLGKATGHYWALDRGGWHTEEEHLPDLADRLATRQAALDAVRRRYT